MPRAALAFEAVHREFRPKLLRYLSGFVDPAEAADLTQVALMKVHDHLDDFRGDSSLATWIYRIATNVALDRLRERSPERVAIETESEDDSAAADERVPTQLRAPSAESVAIREEMSACVREFIDRLPLNYRTVLVLSDIEGFANAEIAEITGLSLDTVKIRLHRARLKLRGDLKSGCTLERDERNELACDRRPARPIK